VIPLLNSVLGDARFIHRAQVYQVLIEALAKTGQISSAETKLKEWQLVYKPATDEVIRLVSLIERVKAVN
jgi:hypothetical protein